MFSDNKHQPVFRKQFKVSGLPSLPLSPVPSQIFWENNYLLDDTLNFSGARWKTVLFVLSLGGGQFAKTLSKAHDVVWPNLFLHKRNTFIKSLDCILNTPN